MTIEIIDIEAAKRVVVVTHGYRDVFIQEKLDGACSEIEHYLGKTLYETSELMDAAIAGGDVLASQSMVINPDVKNACALLVKYHYDGPTAFNADKTIEAAYNILDRYKLITA